MDRDNSERKSDSCEPISDSEIDEALAETFPASDPPRRSSNYWRVAIDHPPLNIFGPDTIPHLDEVITVVQWPGYPF